MRRLVGLAILTMAAVVSSPALSRADFVLTITVGGTTGTIDFTTNTNNTGLTVTEPSAGNYSVTGKFANYQINVNADSFTTTSSSEQVQDSTSSVVATKGSLAPISFALSDTFAGTVPNTPVTISNVLTSSAFSSGSSITGSTSVTGLEGGATEPGSVSLTKSGYQESDGLGTTDGSGSLTISNSVSVSGLGSGKSDQFTLTSEVDSQNGGPLYSSATPAPTGLILAATVVPFFGLIRRRLLAMNASVVA